MVCIVISRMRIASPKIVEVKRKIYFEWPHEKIKDQEMYFLYICTSFILPLMTHAHVLP